MLTIWRTFNYHWDDAWFQPLHVHDEVCGLWDAQPGECAGTNVFHGQVTNNMHILWIDCKTYVFRFLGGEFSTYGLKVSHPVLSGHSLLKRICKVTLLLLGIVEIGKSYQNLSWSTTKMVKIEWIICWTHVLCVGYYYCPDLQLLLYVICWTQVSG